MRYVYPRLGVRHAADCSPLEYGFSGTAPVFEVSVKLLRKLFGCSEDIRIAAIKRG
jgi:hypothetical protein